MKNKVKIIYVTGLLSIVSFFIYFISNEVIKDFSLAIFGGSILSLIIAIINYNTERNKALEDFYSAIKERVRYWSIYDERENLIKK